MVSECQGVSECQNGRPSSDPYHPPVARFQRPSTVNPMAIVSDQQLQQYRDDGYFILERALSDKQLETLRGEAQYAIDKLNKQFDENGVDSIGINHRNKRYFSANVWRDRPNLLEFIKSDAWALCLAVYSQTKEEQLLEMVAQTFVAMGSADRKSVV